MDTTQTLTTLLSEIARFFRQSPYALPQAAILADEWISQLQSTQFTLVALGNSEACKSLLRALDLSRLADDVQILDLSEEDEEMDKVAWRARLAHAHGFLFVTHATQIFPQSQRQLAAVLLGDGTAKQARFVITNMHLIDQNDVDDVHAWVRKLLGRYCTDSQGNLDETLYSERVLFIDQSDPAEIAYFVANLQHSLTNSMTRQMAKASAATQTLIYLIGGAEQQLEQTRQQQQTAIDTLRKEQQQLVQSEQTRQEQWTRLHEQLKNLHERIKFVTQASLVRHLDKMENRWNNDAPRFLELDDLTLPTIGSLSLASTARQRIGNKLKRNVENYLQGQFADWAAELPTLLTQEIENWQLNLKPPFTLSAQALEELNRTFTHALPATLNQEQLAGLLQQRIKAWIGGGELGIVKLIARAALLTVVVVGSSLFSITGLVAWAVFEAIQAGKLQRDVKESVSSDLRRSLFRLLRAELSKPEALGNRFDPALEQAIHEASAEIVNAESDATAAQAHQQRLIQLQQEIVDSEAEQKDLHDQREKIDRLAEELGRHMDAKPLSGQELIALYQRKATIYGVLEAQETA